MSADPESHASAAACFMFSIPSGALTLAWTHSTCRAESGQVLVNTPQGPEIVQVRPSTVECTNVFGQEPLALSDGESLGISLLVSALVYGLVYAALRLRAASARARS